MPIYEFHCASCAKTFEKLSSMSETCAPCPSCEADCAKTISVPAPGQVSSGPSTAGPPPCAATCGKTSGFG